MDINLLSPAEVRALLARHGLHPKKRLGQNFLIDRNILTKIIEAAELTSGSNVLEIGPGLGTVTVEVAKTAARVVAVEADRDLIPVLSETLSESPNADIVNADFLQLDLPEFLSQHFQAGKITVVANLPYYITSPLIIRMIENRNRIERMVVMVQQEVAERLAAAPASEGYGALSVFVQYHCEVRAVAKAKRTVFYPSPDVDSAIVRLDTRSVPAVSVKNEELFFNIVRSAFGQRRKTLVKALSGSPTLSWNREYTSSVLSEAGIEEVRRGETLSLEEFAAITNSVS